MKIVVLNGSPKGEMSVTMQYVEYLERRFPEHGVRGATTWRRGSAGWKGIPRAFKEVIDEVRSADAVIWAFPLYILLVCSQYKRFVELIGERGRRTRFTGKYAATLSTSINYYDSNAHA